MMGSTLVQSKYPVKFNFNNSWHRIVLLNWSATTQDMDTMGSPQIYKI